MRSCAERKAQSRALVANRRIRARPAGHSAGRASRQRSWPRQAMPPAHRTCSPRAQRPGYLEWRGRCFSFARAVIPSIFGMSHVEHDRIGLAGCRHRDALLAVEGDQYLVARRHSGECSHSPRCRGRRPPQALDLMWPSHSTSRIAEILTRSCGSFYLSPAAFHYGWHSASRVASVANAARTASRISSCCDLPGADSVPYQFGQRPVGTIAVGVGEHLLAAGQEQFHFGLPRPTAAEPSVWERRGTGCRGDAANGSGRRRRRRPSLLDRRVQSSLQQREFGPPFLAWPR